MIKSYLNTTEQTLVCLDNLCDYIPLVSVATNLIDFFLKATTAALPEKIVNSSRFLRHIKRKDCERMGMLLSPILGNIIIAHCDNHYGKRYEFKQRTFSQVLIDIDLALENSILSPFLCITHLISKLILTFFIPKNWKVDNFLSYLSSKKIQVFNPLNMLFHYEFFFRADPFFVPEILNSPRYVKKAIKSTKFNFLGMKSLMQYDLDEELLKKAFKKSPQFFIALSPKLQNNIEFQNIFFEYLQNLWVEVEEDRLSFNDCLDACTDFFMNTKILISDLKREGNKEAIVNAFEKLTPTWYYLPGGFYKKIKGEYSDKCLVNRYRFFKFQDPEDACFSKEESLECVKISYKVFPYINSEFKTDSTFVFEAIKQNFKDFIYENPRIAQYPPFIAARIAFSLLMLKEDYFKIKESDEKDERNKIRFYRIGSKIPLELQQLLSNFVMDINKEFIPETNYLIASQFYKNELTNN